MRSDHLSKHIKTHTKNRNPGDVKVEGEEGDLDKADIKSEPDNDGLGTEESDEEGIEMEGEEQETEDQEQETGEMMITINTEGEQSELIISDQQIENQS
jgi:hypothetical protein